MGKGGKSQQAQAQSQKKGGQQNPKQMKDKPSRGCCSSIFSLIRKLIFLTAISAFLYVTTFTGYTYHVKQRVPTVNEFVDFSVESYHVGSEQARKYYAIVDQHTKVYYAQFEKEYLPTIQLYTKRYTKLAVEKAGDLKELSMKYFAVAQKQVEIYYKLALKKIEEFQSGKQSAPTAAPKPATPKAGPTAAPKPAQASTKPPTAAPTQAPVRVPTQAPTRAPTPKPTQAPSTQKAAPQKPVTTPKPTEAPKRASPNSKEKSEL
ncbi:uncharacterized protein LOC100897332 [Galendromus occidentalis]|uniref:Uncharacterized protein LOC100897332 n=1 Tax=Galendromus occidentalis TaxID=34638 RepID=A0AAJ6QQL8_9ACAR|nr:uncharacterized protein LOC100897332 [Galendromus occidentalis]